MLSVDALRVAAAAQIDPSSFYKPTHGRIYRAAAALYGRGEPVDPITVAEELRRDGMLDDVGGLKALVAIQAATPASANASSYAAIVAELGRRRRIQVAAHALVDAGSADEETIERAFRDLIAVAEPPGPSDDRYIDGSSFVRSAANEVPAVWGEDDRVLWARGESLLLVGPAGVGKTTVATQLLAGRIGFLERVIDLPVAAAQHVLYLACDRPAQIGRAFMRLMNNATDDQLAHLTIWQGPPERDIGRHPESLLAMCRAAGADCVFIDSLKDIALGLTDDEVGASVNIAMQQCVAEGIDVIALHHQRKGQAGQKPKTLEDVYGSTWITAGAGSVVLLWGAAGDPVVELSHLKQPAAEVGPIQIDHDHNTGVTTVFRGDVDPLVVLRTFSAGMTARDLATVQTGLQSPSDNALKKAKRTLDKLVFKGLAHKVPGGSTSGTRGAAPDTYFALTDEPGPSLDLESAAARASSTTQVDMYAEPF